MKTKKIITLALAAAMACASAVSVSAAQLTETENEGKTEVKAHIDGTTPEPGDVSYIITIPDVVDFGNLTQPADSSVNSYKDVSYSVSLDEVNGLDTDKNKIAVYVRDQTAKVGSDDFVITNKADSTKSFVYDVYDVTSENISETTESINVNNMTKAIGYRFHDFTTQGERVDGTLRLNQTQLCGYDITDIIGDYSGYMVFRSRIENA